MAAADLVRIQAAVRAQGEEQADAMAGMREWMASIKSKDAQLRSVRSPSAPTPAPRTPASAPATSPLAATAKEVSGTAADHTYDKGYKRWEKFDVNEALEEAEAPSPRGPTAKAAESPAKGATANAWDEKVGFLSRGYAIRAGDAASGVALGATRAAPGTLSPAEMLKEDGNEALKRGDYQSAVSYYTRLLVMEPESFAAYANRALAFLQSRDYRSAIADATAALRRDPFHVKSWMRRASARSALGMYEAAARDLQVALKLEPHNRTVAAEYRKALENYKHNAKRVPEVVMKCE
jgi:tetratricopeptide (TPR) repeat protein